MMTIQVKKPLTGRHILILLLSFFGVILVVNGIFIFFAITTFSGQTSRNPYTVGLRYNQRIALAKAQAVNGLHHKTWLAGDHIRISLKASDGRPAAGFIVTVRLARPASNRSDLNIGLSERADGDYGEAVALSPGAWILELTAQREAAGPAIYQSKERLWLTPKQ